MAHYAGPPRVCLGSFVDGDAAKTRRDELIAQGHNAWLEVSRGSGLVLWRTIKSAKIKAAEGA